MERIYEGNKVDIAVKPQTLSASNVTGSYYPMSNYNEALVVLNVGALADTKIAKVELLEAKDSSGTGAKLITNASAIITSAGGMTEAKAMVSLKTEYMSSNDGFNHIAAKVTTDDNTVISAVLIRGKARFNPVQDADALAIV